MTPELGRAEDALTTPATLYMQAWERRGCRVRFLTRKPGEVLLAGQDWCRALGVPYSEVLEFFHCAMGRAFKLEGVWWWGLDLAFEYAGSTHPILEWLTDRVVEMPDPPDDPVSAYALIVAPLKTPLAFC